MRTTKVKQLAMLCLLVAAMAWSASAQMKVGDNPKTINEGAILELEAQNKGVLYPRVSLIAIDRWTPLQGTAVAGMTVYNTATVTATTSATTSLSPGFYFWEGAKWNKLATDGEVAEGSEWVYDAATKQINLKRSGTVPFANKVYYDETGAFYDYDKKDVEVYDNTTNSVKNTDLTKEGNYHLLAKNFKDLPSGFYSSPINNYRYKKLSAYHMFIEGDTNTGGNSDRPVVLEGDISITPKHTSTLYFPIGILGSVSNTGVDNNVMHSAGINGSSSIGNSAKSSGYVWGSRGYARAGTSGSVNDLSSFGSHVATAGSGSIKNMSILHGTIQYLGGREGLGVSTSAIHRASGIRIRNIFYTGNQAKTESLIAFLYDASLINSGATADVKNHYGLYLSDVDLGSNSNYAIYTHAGDVRFGDLAGAAHTDTSTTDKIVVADTDGVLKTKTAATLVAEAGEWKDGTVSGTNLIYANQAKKAGNDVVITDDGKIGIGTTMPTEELEVNGNVSVGKYIDGRETGTNVEGAKLFFNGVKWNTDIMYMQKYNVASDKTELRVGIGDNNIGDDKFVIGSNVDTNNDKWAPLFTVVNNGNIGVGTTTPTQKLDTRGSIIARTNADDASSTIINYDGGVEMFRKDVATAPETMGYLDFKNESTHDADVRFRITEKTDSKDRIFTIENSSSGDITNTSSVNIPMSFNLTQEKMGIGTTDPQATLDVKGSVKINDGTQGAGKVLTSDSNGKASWENPTMSYAYVRGIGQPAQYFGKGSTMPAIKDKYHYTGMSITLPSKGRYAVLLDLAVALIVSKGVSPQLPHNPVVNEQTNRLAQGEAIMVRGCFWDEILTDGIDKDPIYSLPSKNKANSMFSGTLSYPFGLQRNANTMYIENPTSGPKTYYFYGMAEIVNPQSNTVRYVLELGSGRWAEESLVAFKIGEL